MMRRREFCKTIGVATGAVLGARLGVGAAHAADAPFKLNYLVASALYGKLPLAEVLPEVSKLGSTHIDIWRLNHANQREQIDAMGLDAYASLLDQHDVKMACTTIWGGDFVPELDFVKRFGGDTLVTGFVPDSSKKGDTIQTLLDKHRAGIEKAASLGVTVAFENHGASIDDMRRFADAIRDMKGAGIAFAPYHLPQDPAALASLIEHMGPTMKLFYGWQHGMGCMTKLPKEQELLQLPGRGDLDFTPLLTALKKTHFTGWTEIFMHPTPRGIPIMPTAAEVTAEINRARNYLEQCLAKA
ncbi:MAG: TIM barrel protein [Phycisphaera sp.]|nr:TIM barrel protein [Phycisphaera sp.]